MFFFSRVRQEISVPSNQYSPNPPHTHTTGHTVTMPTTSLNVKNPPWLRLLPQSNSLVIYSCDTNVPLLGTKPTCPILGCWKTCRGGGAGEEGRIKQAFGMLGPSALFEWPLCLDRLQELRNFQRLLHIKELLEELSKL